MEEKITAWVTKYALTTGIEKVYGTCRPEYPNMFTYGQQHHAHGNEWQLTPDAAMDRAEEMRVQRIASLQRSLTKVRAKKIKIIDKTQEQKHG